MTDQEQQAHEMVKQAFRLARQHERVEVQLVIASDRNLTVHVRATVAGVPLAVLTGGESAESA